MSSLSCVRLAYDGESPSLGTLLFPSAEIRAFGPEAPPLGGGAFGVRPVQYHEERWASPLALPEVWFEMQVLTLENRVEIDLSFIGLTVEKPLAFSFYVRALKAEVGQQLVEAGGLRRYSGPAERLLLGEGLQLFASGPSRMEVIPLSGGPHFWNCQYLVAFELPPLRSKFSFLLIEK